MVTEAAGQNSQTAKARTTGHVSGLTFVKVLVMERLQKDAFSRKRIVSGRSPNKTGILARDARHASILL